jgi:transcriptional regulator with XRE-family HTH domain
MDARLSSDDEANESGKSYDPSAFTRRLQELQRNHNLSARALAQRASLDAQAVYRIYYGHRPTMTTCILLANYFRCNPNEFLELAGWPRLAIFDVPEGLAPEVTELIVDLMKIPSPALRQEVVQAIRTLLRQYVLG